MERKLTVWQVLLAIVLGIVILVATQLLLQVTAGMLALPTWLMIIVYIAAGLLCAYIAYLLIKVLCTKILKMQMDSFLIPRLKIKPLWLIVAILLPAAVSFVMLQMKGSLTKNPLDTVNVIALLSSGLFVVGIATGVIEELVFRGVIMNAIENRWGKAWAILLPSVLFAALHVFGRNLDITSILFLLVAGTCVGIMFSLITYAGRSIWNAAAVHALWNAVILGGGLKIGAPENVSGSNSWFLYTLYSKSFFITGGDFGIESSVVAVAGFIIVAVIAFVLMKKQESK